MLIDLCMTSNLKSKGEQHQIRKIWCNYAYYRYYYPPNSLLLYRSSQFFLKMCPPFLSLLVSALFRCPRSISIHLSPRFSACTSFLVTLSLLVGHCVRLVSLLSPFLPRGANLCLAILCLPALDDRKL